MCVDMKVHQLLNYQLIVPRPKPTKPKFKWGHIESGHEAVCLRLLRTTSTMERLLRAGSLFYNSVAIDGYFVDFETSPLCDMPCILVDQEVP